MWRKMYHLVVINKIHFAAKSETGGGTLMLSAHVDVCKDDPQPRPPHPPSHGLWAPALFSRHGFHIALKPVHGTCPEQVLRMLTLYCSLSTDRKLCIIRRRGPAPSGVVDPSQDGLPLATLPTLLVCCPWNSYIPSLVQTLLARDNMGYIKLVASPPLTSKTSEPQRVRVASSTILPLVYEFCPYATAVSKVFRKGYHSIYKLKPPRGDENPKQDLVTSRALSWLIRSCEVPRSVDVALQAIAGAHHNLPREPLKDCDAAFHLYTGKYELVTALYTRALAFLRANKERTTTGYRYSHSVTSRDLDVMVWDMHSNNENSVAKLLGVGNFAATPHDLKALRIGGVAASNCLKLLDGGRHTDLAMVDSATSLLSQHIYRQQISLHPASLASLVHAVGMVFSSALVHAEPHEVVQFPMRLIQACVDINDYERRRAVHRYVGVILSAFVLSRHNFPRWINPSHASYTLADRIDAAHDVARNAQAVDGERVHQGKPQVQNE
ncbi:hypothetical protein BDV93DRAFT_514721 [Ceratobasidium sp. AG-I]|nr:hypothetical protein BDV93DRAFT_514721 [Ceratobasidium sp. AG-I]